MDNQLPDTMTVKQVATAMGTTPRAVQMLISRGRLKSTKIVLGRKTEHRIATVDVLAFYKLKPGWPLGKKRGPKKS